MEKGNKQTTMETKMFPHLEMVVLGGWGGGL
jgi:hypothetical protein